MTEPRNQRRLAAILAADVVGYSRLMQVDEAGTLAALKLRWRDVLVPAVAQHHGRVVKVMGDGVLVEFCSAVDAVECAVALQAGFAKANGGVEEALGIVLRIGINLGDVIVEGTDLFGEGVNIAARLEGIAEPGGICVSASVHEQVRGKLAAAFDDLGPQMLKNISAPQRVYRVRAIERAAGVETNAGVGARAEMPSIAVLAFDNMSGDPEQEYFADGVVEDIITALARLKGLRVIARNSSFSYKGRAVDIKQVGRELGVRYVLEGSIRKAAGRIRLTAQLIEAASGVHLWAEKYEGALEDVFELQDQLVSRVVGAISPRLMQAEIELSRRKPPTSLDAYDHFLRGWSIVIRWTAEAGEEALHHFMRAIELDPTYAAAYGCAANSFVPRVTASSGPLRPEEVAEVARLAKAAVELGGNDDIALTDAASVLGYILGDYQGALLLGARAIALNPNSAYAWFIQSWNLHFVGQFDASIEHCRRAIELSPQDPLMFLLETKMAWANFAKHHYEDALAWSESALGRNPENLEALFSSVASLAMLGRQTEAENKLVRLLQVDPACTRTAFARTRPSFEPGYIEHWLEALRKAGMAH